MISLLSYSKMKSEQKLCKDTVINICSRITDDDLKFVLINNYEDFLNLTSSLPSYDISIFDIVNDRAINAAESARSENKSMFIMIIADKNISPMEYIKPSIMASALLLRPFSKEMLSTVINNLLIEYLKKYSSGDGEKALVIENKGERQIIPYTNIMYLESRSKKIYVIVGNKEYSYYDTLDNLENKLGSEFIRCHRSYIVSRYYIKKIQLSQNLIVLNDDSLIPISRSYKSRFKELK